MKEFDLEEAKKGKPVCTRDGRKARIICFDCNNEEEHPILALVDLDRNGKEIIMSYTINGEGVKGARYGHDLVMIPQKRQGWVNLYKSHDPEIMNTSPCYSTKDIALSYARKTDKYIGTFPLEFET